MWKALWEVAEAHVQAHDLLLGAAVEHHLVRHGGLDVALRPQVLRAIVVD